MEQTFIQAREDAERLRRRHGYLLIKRIFDIGFSVTVLGTLSWLFLLVALAIKLDDPRGPVFFIQERIGASGNPFYMIKFRSMCVDAEQQVESLQMLNERDGPAFKILDDPRITNVGRFIRRMNIDELPQFVNVLRGDMSVVGPRPALQREVIRYTDYQRLRLLIKPGITCLWQIDPNRDNLTFDEWVARDLRYLHECSALYDLNIIFRTIGCTLRGNGA